MREKLSERFRPSRLDIIDESHRHEGHAEARPGGETHFMI
ncbi:MAG TPA: BolA/IbaG family iron-sulfur metabolism protein, partial [Stellaceae bacterium]|nr:BolA/IbaG family iron-sulfur metabolism protein [Stellaceae bacterium]